jgi:hypothetical protein
LKDFHGVQKSLHIGLAAFTVLSAWRSRRRCSPCTMHTAERHHHALTRCSFRHADPDYADFFCFACVIGT